MKQVLQMLRDGETIVESVPRPMVRPGHVLIRTRRSVISPGTERMLKDFGQASLIGKVRQQPEKARAVIDKIGTDGLVTTLEAVKAKLDQPIASGYASMGTVLEVGDGVTGFSIGDRVASNGGHADITCVSANLCARVPEPVSDDAAAFTVLGSIALQGIRLAQPTLGESVAVFGMGLIGQLTVQLLAAQGCRVLALDFEPARLEMARRFGAETHNLAEAPDPLAAATAFSRGRGIDAVIITAATKSSAPVRDGAAMCRKRGRMVLVGVTGLELSRDQFYEKELTFQVSCSYGPGRYDPAYEQGGHDYPVGFVRWTEQRNFEAVLDMMARGAIDVAPLITHRFDIAEADAAYGHIGDGAALAILLQYESEADAPDEQPMVVPLRAPRRVIDRPGLAVIGAGAYAQRFLLPALANTDADRRIIASESGFNGVRAGRKFGFETATTDLDRIFDSPDIDIVVIATPHHNHAALVERGLRASKHVFVEKPLAIDQAQLDRITELYRDTPSPGALMVGFNRRFAPHVTTMMRLLTQVSGPRAILITINAGAIPADHWTQNREIGGGRIIGEGCHFVDLARHLAGAAITEATAIPMQDRIQPLDSTAATLSFANGSVAAIHYLANGHRRFPKEHVTVFAGGRTLTLDNFRTLTAHGWPGTGKKRAWRQDKGNMACLRAFVEAVRQGQDAPIPVTEILEVSQATIDLDTTMRAHAGL